MFNNRLDLVFFKFATKPNKVPRMKNVALVLIKTILAFLQMQSSCTSTTNYTTDGVLLLLNIKVHHKMKIVREPFR